MASGQCRGCGDQVEDMHFHMRNCGKLYQRMCEDGVEFTTQDEFDRWAVVAEEPVNTVEVMPAMVMSPADVARARAERIRGSLETAAQDYAQAVIEGDWRVLGYASVAEWASAEFGAHRFTVDARRLVAQLLSGSGQTVREIAAATQVSHPTVVADLARGQNLTTTETDQPGDRKPVTTVSGTGGTPRQRAAREREQRRREPGDQEAYAAEQERKRQETEQRKRREDATLLLCEVVVALSRADGAELAELYDPDKELPGRHVSLAAIDAAMESLAGLREAWAKRMEG